VKTLSDEEEEKESAAMQEPDNEISLLHDPSTALKFQN
jgi:hypothetical protein